MLSLLDVLRLLDPEVLPSLCKVHFACRPPEGDDPYEAYLRGKFDEWQCWQSKRNFSRPHIISLIQLSERDRWLFAGVHDQHGCEERHAPQHHFLYRTTRRATTEPYNGRIVVMTRFSDRQRYQYAETFSGSLDVAEILAQPLDIGEFPGFKSVHLSKAMLDLVFRRQSPSWKGALSSVAGVYAITDTSTGRVYVGSAYGADGVWGRWSEYAKTGHGGNVDLCALLGTCGPDHADHFVFGILETADSRATSAEILDREQHWKKLLCSRSFGHNRN